MTNFQIRLASLADDKNGLTISQAVFSFFCAAGSLTSQFVIPLFPHAEELRGIGGADAAQVQVARAE